MDPPQGSPLLALPNPVLSLCLSYFDWREHGRAECVCSRLLVQFAVVPRQRSLRGFDGSGGALEHAAWEALRDATGGGVVVAKDAGETFKFLFALWRTAAGAGDARLATWALFGHGGGACARGASLGVARRWVGFFGRDRRSRGAARLRRGARRLADSGCRAAAVELLLGALRLLGGGEARGGDRERAACRCLASELLVDEALEGLERSASHGGAWIPHLARAAARADAALAVKLARRALADARVGPAAADQRRCDGDWSACGFFATGGGGDPRRMQIFNPTSM